MKKIAFLIMLLLIILETNNFVYAKVQNIKVSSDDTVQNFYNYSFPTDILHNGISKLDFHQDYNLFNEKCSAYIYIKLKEDQNQNTFIELNKIELITKNASWPNEPIIPIQIKSVSFDKNWGFSVFFEYSLAHSLFKTAKLKFYFNVKNINETKSVEYTIDFKDLKESFRKI